jgi:hypothetical protein
MACVLVDLIVTSIDAGRAKLLERSDRIMNAFACPEKKCGDFSAIFRLQIGPRSDEMKPSGWATRRPRSQAGAWERALHSTDYFLM